MGTRAAIEGRPGENSAAPADRDNAEAEQEQDQERHTRLSEGRDLEHVDAAADHEIGRVCVAGACRIVGLVASRSGLTSRLRKTVSPAFRVRLYQSCSVAAAGFRVPLTQPLAGRGLAVAGVSFDSTSGVGAPLCTRRWSS